MVLGKKVICLSRGSVSVSVVASRNVESVVAGEVVSVPGGSPGVVGF